MLLEGPTAAELIQFIEEELVPITQAEPKPLAKYVMALLKKDRSLSSLETLCNRQLQEFLGDATSSFVRKLFARLRSMQPSGSDDSGGGRRRSGVGDAVVIELLPQKRSQSRGRDGDDEYNKRRRRDGGERGGERLTEERGGYGGGGRDFGRDGFQGREPWEGRGGRGGRGPPGRPPPQGHPGLPQGHFHQGPPAGFPPPPFPPPGMQVQVQQQARGGSRDGRIGNIPPRDDTRKSSTTLHITNVPKELNTIIQLVEHFKQFGSVVNIQVRQDQDRAFVQFSNRQEAQDAIRSSEAVLGNRFIRVYWSKGDGSAPLGAPPRGYAVPSNEQGSQLQQGFERDDSAPGGVKQQHPIPRAAAGHQQLPERSALSFERTPSATPRPPPPSAEAIAKARAAKAKKAELQGQLREKLISQQKDIMTLLTAKKDSLDEASKEKLKKTLATINEQLAKLLHGSAAAKPSSPAAKSALESAAAPSTPSTPASDNAAKLAALRQKLAAVQQEAQAHGVDTTAVLSPSFPSSRGRGRGSRGGRGGRGTPGRGRGGRGGGASAFGARKLDNRPTAIAISKLPEELCGADALEEVQSQLSALGDAVVTVGEDGVIANFSSRQAAEQVMNSGLSLSSGALELSWHRPPPETAQFDAPVSVYQFNKEGTAAGEGDAEVAPLPAAEAYGDDYLNDRAGDDEEEDEDDEQQERSWKR